MLSSLYNGHLSRASPSCQNKLLTRLVGSKLFDIDFSHFIFLRGRRGEGVGEGGGVRDKKAVSKRKITHNSFNKMSLNVH